MSKKSITRDRRPSQKKVRRRSRRRSTKQSRRRSAKNSRRRSTKQSRRRSTKQSRRRASKSRIGRARNVSRVRSSGRSRGGGSGGKGGGGSRGKGGGYGDRYRYKVPPGRKEDHLRRNEDHLRRREEPLRRREVDRRREEEDRRRREEEERAMRESLELEEFRAKKRAIEKHLDTSKKLTEEEKLHFEQWIREINQVEELEILIRNARNLEERDSYRNQIREVRNRIRKFAHEAGERAALVDAGLDRCKTGIFLQKVYPRDIALEAVREFYRLNFPNRFCSLAPQGPSGPIWVHAPSPQVPMVPRSLSMQSNTSTASHHMSNLPGAIGQELCNCTNTKLPEVYSTNRIPSEDAVSLRYKGNRSEEIEKASNREGNSMLFEASVEDGPPGRNYYILDVEPEKRPNWTLIGNDCIVIEFLDRDGRELAHFTRHRGRSLSPSTAVHIVLTGVLVKLANGRWDNKIPVLRFKDGRGWVPSVDLSTVAVKDSKNGESTRLEQSLVLAINTLLDCADQPQFLREE